MADIDPEIVGRGWVSSVDNRPVIAALTEGVPRAAARWVSREGKAVVVLDGVRQGLVAGHACQGRFRYFWGRKKVGVWFFLHSVGWG